MLQFADARARFALRIKWSHHFADEGVVHLKWCAPGAAFATSALRLDQALRIPFRTTWLQSLSLQSSCLEAMAGSGAYSDTLGSTVAESV